MDPRDPLPALRRAALAALLVAVAAGFAVGLRNGFVWDDAQLIVLNAGPLSLATVRDAFGRHFWDTAGFTLAGRAHFYRPVVTLAYAATRAAFGAGPLGFHAVNLAVHLAVVALAFDLVRRRVDPARRSPEAVLATTLAVGAFALHPARAESVSWSSGAPDLWAALLLLVALRLGPARRPLAAALAFALALLAKEAVALAPLALLVDALLLRAPGARRPALRGAAALGAALAAVVIVRAAVLPPSSLRVGPALAATARILASAGHLVARTFAPWPLTVWTARVAHDAHGLPVRDPAYVALGAALVVALALVAVAARSRAAARPWAADLAWVALALVPVCNPLDLGLAQLVADRYLYLPHLALAALLARALDALLARAPRRAVLAPAAVALALLGALAFAHARHFHDELGLWRHEVEVDPANPMARLSLARAVASQRRYGEALAHARRGIVDANAQNARAIQMDGVLLAAAILLDGLPDADQRGLASVRGFLDALGNHPGEPASLDAGGLRMQLRLGPDDAARVRAMTDAWALPLADAALRTLAPMAARDQYRALEPRLPGQARPYVGVALSLVLLDELADARSVLAHAPPSAAAGVARVRGVLASAACADDPADARAGKVRCALALDLREHARRLATQPPDEAIDPGLLRATITADVRDGLCRRARRRLDQARARDAALDLAEAEREAARCREFQPRME